MYLPILITCVGFEGYELHDDRYEEWLESREHGKLDVSDNVTKKQSTKMSHADKNELVVWNC